MQNRHFPGVGRVIGVCAMMMISAAPSALAEDETQACQANGQPVAYGAVLANCAIEVPADLDIFTFVGVAGEFATAIATETVGSNATAVCAEIRRPAPDDTPIAGPACGNTTVRFDVGPLPLSGVYRIVMTELGNDSAINFNLSLERMAPLRAPTPIGPGDTISGRQILPVADLDTFSFDVNVGDQHRLILTETTGTNATAVCVEIRGPDQSTVVGLTCNNTSVDLTLPPSPIAGTHQLIVTEGGNDSAIGYNLSLNCLSGTCAPRLPACMVDPSYDGSTLTLDFTLGSQAPTEWHVAILAFGQVFTLWRVPIPVVDPAVTFSLPIPGFPSLGTIGVLSTLTSGADLVCTDLRTVATGTPLTIADPEALRRYLGTNFGIP